VFQARPLPFSNNKNIVTCGADGEVRVAHLPEGGGRDGLCTRHLGQHGGRAHKLATIPSDADTFLSCGEDGVVLSVDTRDTRATSPVLRVREVRRPPEGEGGLPSTAAGGGRKIGLNSIALNPSVEQEFCVAGDDSMVRVFDRRKLGQPVRLLYPGTASRSRHITCATYSYDGAEIVATYSEDAIYLFANREGSVPGEYVRKYEGHLNERTVKGVNVFGPRSEFVVSGSDCGNLFFWDKATGDAVQMLHGDRDVVNCLEPHPHLPVLATSGIDSDVKVWAPTREEPEGGDKFAQRLERQAKTNHHSVRASRRVQMLQTSMEQMAQEGGFAVSFETLFRAFMGARAVDDEEEEAMDESDDDDDDEEEEEEVPQTKKRPAPAAAKAAPPAKAQKGAAAAATSTPKKDAQKSAPSTPGTPGSAKKVPEDVKAKVRQILSGQPKGIKGADFPREWQKMHGTPMKDAFAKLGFKKQGEFMKALEDTVRSEGTGSEITFFPKKK